MLQEIKEKVKLVKNPKMILMGFEAWQRMVREENLVGKFCTNCKNFLEPDRKHCTLCKSDKEEVIDRELTVLTIENIPFQVTDCVRTDEVKVI